MNLRRASATAVRRFPGRKLSPSVAAAGRRDGHAEGHVAEEEEDDVGPEVRVEDVSAAEGRVGRAGDRERGEADDGGRRHREDGLVVAEHLARREEDVLEPRERDDVQAPEHELEGRGRPDPLDAEEDDVRLRRVPEHEQRGEPPVLRPRQAARVGPRGAGRGREDRGGGEERDERVARGPVCKSNLQPDFNVRVFECFDTNTSAVLRELAESNRFVQKSAESTSI